MTRLESPPQPEDLLAHSAWMKPLARRLLSDDAGAEDVVQETWLAFLRRPPRSADASPSWLRRVVRNLALRSRQARNRRENRERRAARPERISVTPDQVIEQAEMHRLLVEEVLGMEEPYRSTVLLRFFGEQSAAEIALREELPLDTVKTRLRRAIEQLRGRLDRLYGGREAWTFAVLPLAGGAAALAGGLTSAPVSASTTAACATGVGSTGGATSAASITGISLGGLIVAQKTFLTLGLIGIFAVAGGFGLGRFTSKPDVEEAKARLGLVERGQLDAAEARLQGVTAELAKAQLTAATVRGEKEELATRVAALDKEIEAELQESKAKAVAEDRPKLAFSFGKYADLEALQTADWAEMADAAKNIGELFAQVMEKTANGEKPDEALQMKIQEQNMKLVKPYFGLVGKIATNAPGANGEFTHPILTANLLGAMLENAEVPFTADQKKAVTRIGSDYESRYDQLQSGYDEATPKLEKFMDELELKREVMKGMQNLLTPDQKAAAYHPDLQDTMGDVLSPMVMAYIRGTKLDGSSPEALRTALSKQVTEKYELASGQVSALGGAFDAWLEEVRPHLAPAKEGELPRLDQTAAAGRAQVNLYRKILALPDLDEKARQKILDGQSWWIPRLVTQGGG